MTITTKDLKQLIREKLTDTDKADIEKIVRTQIKDQLDKEVTKSVEKVVKSELKSFIKIYLSTIHILSIASRYDL